jgi:hypothetical protein
MKTTRILSAVSAAALLGISSVALAQGTGPSTGGGAGSGASGAPPSNTMQRQQDTAPSGSMSKDSMSKDSMSKDSKDGMKGQAQGKDATKSNQAQGKDGQKSTQTQGMDSQKSTTSQSGQMGKDSQKSQAQTPPAADSKSQMTKEDGAKGGAKSDTTVGAATSGGVNLSTEQRTTIRQEVLTTNAPRVNNVNFSISVGTVVPREVRVIEVPATIVRIQPRWKGYRYFVYNDEIIIVEPRTLKIVAVLDV